MKPPLLGVNRKIKASARPQGYPIDSNSAKSLKATKKHRNRRPLLHFPSPPLRSPLSFGMSSPAEAAREHVEKIRRERYYIGRGEQNPLSEDMHQAVNYLSQELYSKDVHFLMEIVQVKNLAFLHMIHFLFLCHTLPYYCRFWSKKVWFTKFNFSIRLPLRL
jgi:hypothetical protein